MSGLPFTDYIATARLDDSELRTSLARAERVVEASANKQQASLNKMGTGASTAASGLKTFKIAATSAGATIALIDPTIGGLVARLSAMANALKIVGLSLGTLGLAAGAALVIAYRKEISEWVIAQTALGQALKKSEEQLARFTTRAKEMREARHVVGSDLETLRDQLKFERGEIGEKELQQRTALRAQFGGDPFAMDKMEVQQEIDAQRAEVAARMAARMTASNFSIALRDTNQFRLQRTAGQVIVGDQRNANQEKQTRLQELILQEIKQAVAKSRNWMRDTMNSNALGNGWSGP